MLLLAVVFAAPAAAQEQDCLTADPPPVTKPSHPLRFGITPGAAGSVGTGQGQVATIDEARASAALADLRPRNKQLVMRLNRLFWADGDAGIQRFAALVDRYEAEGFRTESQIRYHPPEGSEGDIPAWEEYVRKVVRELGKRKSVVAFSVTNEANLALSPNTSDGAYDGVIDALTRGVVVARDEARKIGRDDIDIGFTLMWRNTPENDEKFWNDIAARAGGDFHDAIDYVGLQIYPGLVWPPAPRPGVSAGEETIEALTLIRRCYMPKAKLGDDVDLWVSENGYATNLGRTEADQATALDSTVRDLHRYAGELGISDYRWFNLRDNNSKGTDLFAAVGLLRDDYSPKPAFGMFRGLVESFGTSNRRARPAVSVRLERTGRRLVTARVRVAVPRGTRCAGQVKLRHTGGRRTAAVPRSCAFATRFRAPRRARHFRVVARFGGNRELLPARARPRLVRFR